MVNSKTTEFGKIYKTTNYGLFKTIESNRKLNPLNYSKLLKSMKEKQLIIPICVNDKYEIIDGQHRVKVCTELKLPIYYYMLKGYSTAEMKRANLVSANWEKDDFLNAYVNDGFEDYADFNEMKIKYGLNSTDLLKIVAKIQNTNYQNIALMFDEGSFKISSAEISGVSAFLNALESFNFFKEYKRSRFISAFLELYFFDGYDHSQMLARLKTRASMLVPHVTKDEYIKILANKIYSFGVASKNNIFYDGDRKKMYKLD